jgi:hypothetical protein
VGSYPKLRGTDELRKRDRMKRQKGTGHYTMSDRAVTPFLPVFKALCFGEV